MTDFEKIIWDGLSQDENYHFIKHKLIKCREMMLKRIKHFSTMSLDVQYIYCCHTCNIADATALDYVSKLGIGGNEKHEDSIFFEYSPPKYIPIGLFYFCG